MISRVPTSANQARLLQKAEESERSWLPLSRTPDLRTMFTKLCLIVDALRGPKYTINCCGDHYCRSIWWTFTRRHPKLPLFRRKTLGVALRNIEGPRDELFSGSRFEMMRRKVRKAEKLGYRVQELDPGEWFDAILAINTSALHRQGHEIGDDYTDLERVREYNKQPGPWFGVFDSANLLRAYCHSPIFGDAFVYSRIIGDARHLDCGIMYLLIRDTTLAMADRRAQFGFPRWSMYDMYIGAPEGLRRFKRRTGFDAVRVNWRWVGNIDR